MIDALQKIEDKSLTVYFEDVNEEYSDPFEVGTIRVIDRENTEEFSNVRHGGTFLEDSLPCVMMR